MTRYNNKFFLNTAVFLCFLCFTCLLAPLAFAKKGELEGIVLNAKDEPLEGAMVVIDGKLQVFTNSKGEFSVPYARKREPKEVVTFLKGYKEQAWFYNPDNGTVKIVMEAGNVLAGQVTNEGGDPLTNTSMILTGFKTEKTLETDNDGYFRLLLPADVSLHNKFTFKIKGRVHSSDYYVFSPGIGFYHITYSGEKEKEKQKDVYVNHLVIKNPQSHSISRTPVIIDNIGYVTDDEGKIDLKTKVPENTHFKLNGFSILHSTMDESSETLTLVVMPLHHKILSVDTTDEIIDGPLSDIDKDFDLILRNLQKESDLADRNTELITSEVDKIQNRLAKGEKLSNQNKKQLADYLKKIQVSVNEVYENETEEHNYRSEELISKLQLLLLEKDSLNKITQTKLLKVQEAKAREEAEWHKRITQYSLVGIVLLGLAIAGYASALTIRKQKNQLALSNKELESSKEQINHLYNEQTDSIKTAQVIQEAILPPTKLIKAHLPEHFIFFKPKDLVSGDFYWFEVKGGAIYLAVVDCTGHGVSGGFTSMLGYSLLNLALQTEADPSPAMVLDKLNEGVIRSLRQGTEDSQSKDGMDISLIKWRPGSNKIELAYGGNPFYIVRNNELLQYKGDKFSIGIPKLRKEVPKFTNFELDVQKGDMLYLFSDGYADELGGQDGTQKFMYPAFRELLVNIHLMPMETQRDILNETITKWIGKNEQVDDLTVIGIKMV